MMKHKHYEMIMAKAANMELVVFLENDQGWSEKKNQSDIQFHEQFDYFLCLPQHNESGQCLHWLNGGAIESNEAESWVEVDSLELCTSHWYDGHFFMHEHEEFRIKPNKEKRWIGVYGNHVTDGMYPTKELCERCVSRSDKFKHCATENWQFIEIEVEV